jgi:hypothetical protein
MRYIILLLALSSLCGCKPKTKQEPAYIVTEHGKMAIGSLTAKGNKPGVFG